MDQDGPGAGLRMPISLKVFLTVSSILDDSGIPYMPSQNYTPA
jgi:Na+/H+ antiporter NhaA